MYWEIQAEKKTKTSIEGQGEDKMPERNTTSNNNKFDDR